MRVGPAWSQDLARFLELQPWTAWNGTRLLHVSRRQGRSSLAFACALRRNNIRAGHELALAGPHFINSELTQRGVGHRPIQPAIVAARLPKEQIHSSFIESNGHGTLGGRLM